MTTSPYPTAQSLLSPIQAQVTALTCRETAWGDRIYAVFNTADGTTLGFWDHADHPILRSLRLGDTITLHRKPNGHFTLTPPSPPPGSQGFFKVLKQVWPWRQ